MRLGRKGCLFLQWLKARQGTPSARDIILGMYWNIKKDKILSEGVCFRNVPAR